jgi:excinuclease ABC subunit C
MGKCLGVCTKEITPELYKEKVINPLKMFLRGHKKRLVKQIEKDMLIAAKEEQFEEAARLRDQLKQLQKIQDMTLINQSFFDYNIGARTNEIVKVEAYDISNLGATGKVGSMVVSMYGEPDKSQYRKFKIRGVDGQSDVDCMEEVIRRRLKHHEWRFPELFLIDGGKPQVNRVQKIFDELDINIPIVGIAKGPDRKKDEFTFSNKRTRDLTKWIQSHQEELIKLRDEAHRFAITYQRKLRKLKK